MVLKKNIKNNRPNLNLQGCKIPIVKCKIDNKIENNLKTK